MLLLQDWRKKRVAPLASAIYTPDGTLCSQPEEIASEIARHWSGVFGSSHAPDPEAARIIFARTPEITWPELEYSIPNTRGRNCFRS
eukprot:1426647-Amphidinium_carterae.1